MSTSSQTVRLTKSRIVEVVLNSTLSKAKILQNESRLSQSSSSSDEEDVSNYADSEENEESSIEDDEQDSVPGSAPLTPRSGSSKMRYCCTYPSCKKVYTKPCRLAEHFRSHTGEVISSSIWVVTIVLKIPLCQRPFTCKTCQKSYLRDSHLQAHMRSHLPESDRPLQCTHDGCSKRFWTSQHLNFHISAVHNREKPFNVCEHINANFVWCNIFGSSVRKIIVMLHFQNTINYDNI